LVDFILASTPGGFDGAVANATPTVTECEVHWVVNLLNATVSGGILKEETLKTLEFPSDLSNPWDPTNSNVYLANFSMVLPDPHSFTGLTSDFGMDNVTARKNWQVFAEFMPSTLLRPSSQNPVQTGPVLKWSWLTVPTWLLTIPSGTLIWEAPANVSELLGVAINTMNQIARRNPNSASGTHNVAEGTAFKTVVLVDIRWVWISLPVILLLFSLMFLVATVIRSKKAEDHIGIWKTSALAILFNGPGEDVQNHVGTSSKMGYTRAKAKELKVQLGDD